MKNSGQPVEVAGTVRELLPNALYRIQLDGQQEVLAHAASQADRNFIRLLVGDRVFVALSPFDPGRARIVKRA